MVVQAVENKLESHLDRLCLGTTVLRPPSVAEILQNVLRHQACVVVGSKHSAFDQVLDDVQDMLGGGALQQQANSSPQLGRHYSSYHMSSARNN